MQYNGTDFVKVVHAISAASITATSTSSAAIDTKGFTEAMVIANFGKAASSAEADVFVMESVSTTAASFAHIAGSSFTQVTPTAGTFGTRVLSIDLRNRKRYLRVKNKGDGSNAVVLSANVLLLNGNSLPVTQSATEVTRI